ncbi:unnamed protein product, partial [Rotaria magnacalcarata]
QIDRLDYKDQIHHIQHEIKSIVFNIRSNRLFPLLDRIDRLHYQIKFIIFNMSSNRLCLI